MEDKFNIDDSIVLNPKGGRANNIKKILTAIAILVVLFLIILIIMRLINSGNIQTDNDLQFPSENTINDNPPIVTNESEKIVIDTEPKKIVIKNDVSLPTLNKSSSIKTNDTKNNLNDIAKPVENKEQSFERDQQEKHVEQKIVVVSSNKQEAIKPQTEIKQKPIKEIEVVKQKPKVEPKPTSKNENSHVKVEEKSISKNKNSRVKVEEKSKHGSFQTSAIQKGDYIQVLAVSKFRPDEAYIKKLTSKGYSYKLYKVTISGKEFTKILVGPYDEKTLQKELANIRATINKNAFKYTIKK